jgi:hypothetical protein
MTGRDASAAIVDGVRAVAPLLAGPARPALEVAARLGEVVDGEPGGRLVLVAPVDTRWRRIRVLVDDRGAAAALVLELHDAAELALAELTTEFGDPDEEWPPDARRPRYAFEAPDLSCAVEVTVRHAAAGGGWVADAIALSRR